MNGVGLGKGHAAANTAIDISGAVCMGSAPKTYNAVEDKTPVN